MPSIEKLETDLEELQRVYNETLSSYLELKERYRKIAEENITMNIALQKIYMAVDDYKKGRF